MSDSAANQCWTVLLCCVEALYVAWLGNARPLSHSWRGWRTVRRWTCNLVYKAPIRTR